MTDPLAGGSTVPAAANAAPDAPRRNRPRFDDLPVPDVALRLVCSSCGRKDRISTRPDFSRAHAGAGPKLRSVE